MDVLGVDGLLQPRQLPTKVARPREPSLEQPGLEPAVEVLHAAVELRLPGRDGDRLDAEAQAQPDHPREDVPPAPSRIGSRTLSNWTCAGRPRSL